MIAPPAWQDQDIVLFHGTDERSAKQILREPITLDHAKPGTDFGPGFYTTTIENQAETWAIKRARPLKCSGAVVRITVPRHELATLDTLSFVVGDHRDAVHFWSLVWHCRNGALNHERVMPAGGGKASYDLVCGPVAAFWEQQSLLAGADQFSFHTVEAIAVLNRAARKRMIRL